MKLYLKKYSFYLFFVCIAIGSYTINGWSKYQYGNIILDNSKDKMAKEKVDFVVFPHWIHSMWFKCKSCHESPFEMKKGATSITMKEINNGEKCGICHNGNHAFSSKECKRCHSLSSGEAALTLKTDKRTKLLYPSLFTKKLTKGREKVNKNLTFADPKNVSVKEYKKIADTFNIEWNEAYFSEGELPKDRLKTIDFEKIFFVDKAITPIVAIAKDKKEEVRDNVIIFEVLSDFVDSVAFKHKEHSTLISCDTCHEKVFKSELGVNEVHMKRNANGEFCGFCHSRVAFSLAECVRCHKYPKGEKVNLPGEILKRDNPLAGKKLLVKGGKLIIEGQKSALEIKEDLRTSQLAKQKILEAKKSELMPLAKVVKPKAAEVKAVAVKKDKPKIIPIVKEPTQNEMNSKPVKKQEPLVKKVPEKEKTKIDTVIVKNEEGDSKPVTLDESKPDNEGNIESKEVEKKVKPKGGWCIIFRWF